MYLLSSTWCRHLTAGVLLVMAGMLAGTVVFAATPAAGLAVALNASSGSGDVASALQDAQEAMGNPTAIQYSATGMNAFYGQAITSGEEWPPRELAKYTRTINYETRAAAEEFEFTEFTYPSQQYDYYVNGDKAWLVTSKGLVVQLAAAEERQLQIWLTPHGFIKAAEAADDATLSEAEGASTISFTALGKFRVKGTIDAQNLVTRVATKIGDPVLGDTDVIATYSNYRDYEGVKFPGKIEIEQGGFPLFELDITTVTLSAPLDLSVPEAVATAPVPIVQAVSTELAPGVWLVAGGNDHSVVVEFDEYLAVVEAPLNEARSQVVIAEARRLAPNKPIRYVLTTHHHFDHVGGLRTYVAEGATVVTHESNVAYFEKTLTAPATISPDAQSRNPKKPVFESVSDRFEITDGKQRIELYSTEGDFHTGEFTLIFLPEPGILVVGDGYSPKSPDAVPVPSPPATVTLDDYIRSLKLDVRTIAPVHGRGAVPYSELQHYLGRD